MKKNLKNRITTNIQNRKWFIIGAVSAGLIGILLSYFG